MPAERDHYRRTVLFAALFGLLLGAAPAIVFWLTWKPCLFPCWPD